MDVQGMASPGDWVAARKALMQDLARLRDQFASGMSLGSRTLAPLLGFAGTSEDGWNGCLNRLEAFLVFAQASHFES
jgi:hypothetical protein